MTAFQYIRTSQAILGEKVGKIFKKVKKTIKKPAF
jgi:hypothetical protein